jgi:rod shape-determining protein MreC
VTRKREGWSLIILIAILIALIFLEPEYGWRIREWLSPSATGQGDDASITAENEALKAQLAVLQSVAAQLPQAPSDYLRAMVYSRYPLNFKNEILVNAGTNEGVVAGNAVIFQGIFIGTVTRVFSGSSLIQTVFDSGFKMPVRVGTGGYDALLAGGADPKADSIAKDATVSAGDIVYTAASGTPYGLPVAIVTGTSTSADDLFQVASLGFAYDLNTIETVLIAK